MDANGHAFTTTVASAGPSLDAAPSRDLREEISSLMDSAFSASSSPRDTFSE